MKKLGVFFLLMAPLALGFALQDATQALIDLDKKWGEANLKGDKTAVASLLADDLVVVSPEGVATKSELLAALEPSGDTTYIADDYKVMMLGSDTAVMTHRAGSPDESYRSLHVWVKRDGGWQCVATAAVPQSTSGN